MNASIDSLRYFSYALVDLTTYVTLTKKDSSDLLLSQSNPRDLQNSKDIAPVYRGTTELRRLGLVQWRQRTLLKNRPPMNMGSMLWWAPPKKNECCGHYLHSTHAVGTTYIGHMGTVGTTYIGHILWALHIRDACCGHNPSSGCCIQPNSSNICCLLLSRPV